MHKLNTYLGVSGSPTEVLYLMHYFWVMVKETFCHQLEISQKLIYVPNRHDIKNLNTYIFTYKKI